jgi:fibronectin type 3 domain-containing protein
MIFMEKIILIFTIVFTMFSCDGVISGSKEGTGIFGIPDAPTVSTTANTEFIRVSWSAISGTSSYNVYRSTSASGTYSVIMSTSATFFNDSGGSAGVMYYYKVSAVNAADKEGEQSTAVSGTLLLLPPDNVAASSATGAINVSWDSVPGASSYKVYKSTPPSDTYTSIATTTSQSYDDTNVTEGPTYYYKVSAVNIANIEGSQSAAVSATYIVPTSNVTFTLSDPTGTGNSLSGGGSSRTVTVRVENGTDNVEISVAKTVDQRVSVSGTNAADVFLDDEGIGTTTTTIIVDTSDISSDGGSSRFSLRVTETDKSPITYNITVNVAR